MRKKKYLLMTPPAEVVRQKRDTLTDPMLSIGYLAAALRIRGFDVEIFDPKYEGLTIKESFERVKKINPTFVGLSSMTHEIVRAHKFAAMLKKWCKDVSVAIGGPHATSLPSETMKEFSNFDFLVQKEGEETILELASYLENKALNISEIKGLVYRNSEEIRINEAREWNYELDNLPFPAWDLYPQFRRSAFPILASRGCPYNCLFCMRVLGNKQRKRNPKNIVNEMEWLVNNFNPIEIHFEDETFGIDKESTYEICHEMQSRGLHRRIKWRANIRINLVTEEFLSKIKESGCDSVGIGIESGNEKILKDIKKGITLSQAEKVVRMCKNIKLGVRTYFILGHPNETLKTAIDTIRFAAKIKPTYTVFGIMVPYPNTEIAKMAERSEGGYRLLSKDWSDYDKHLGNALELKKLSRKKLEFLQMGGYIYFYLRNLRLFDLLKFSIEQRIAIYNMFKKFLGISKKKIFSGFIRKRE